MLIHVKKTIRFMHTIYATQSVLMFAVPCHATLFEWNSHRQIPWTNLEDDVGQFLSDICNTVQFWYICRKVLFFHKDLHCCLVVWDLHTYFPIVYTSVLRQFLEEQQAKGRQPKLILLYVYSSFSIAFKYSSEIINCKSCLLFDLVKLL
jgi:hypothetical protein